MSATIRQVKLIEVCGDQEEFSDLIGEVGKLRLDDKCNDAAVNWFSPGGGESLNLSRKRVTEKDGKVIVHTRLDNTFVFKVLERQ